MIFNQSPEEWDRKNIRETVSVVAAVLTLLITLIALLFGEGLLKDKLSLKCQDVQNDNSAQDIYELQENENEILVDDSEEQLNEEEIIAKDSEQPISGVELIDGDMDIYDKQLEYYYRPDGLKMDSSNFPSGSIEGPYNTSEVRVDTTIIGLIIKYNEFERYLGAAPIKEIQANFYLKKNEDDSLVDYKVSNLGQEVVFSNIPDGTYYYMIESDGYKNSYSNFFTIQKDSSKEESNLIWPKNLEKEDSKYSNPFRIRILDDLGKPMMNIKTNIRVVENNNLKPNKFETLSLVTDEEGYIADYRVFEGKYIYDTLEFSVAEGFCVQVEDSLGRFQIVKFSDDGTGVITN